MEEENDSKFVMWLTEATERGDARWEETYSPFVFGTHFNGGFYLIGGCPGRMSVSGRDGNNRPVHMDEDGGGNIGRLYSLVIGKNPEFGEKMDEKFRSICDSEIDEERFRKTIAITPELAGELDGRCFLDLDMVPNRVDAFRFTRTSTGIDMVTVGCDDHWGYSRMWHDDYGEYEINDTFCGLYVDMVVGKSHLVREIPQEKFDRANRMANEAMEEAEKRKDMFGRKRKEFGLLGD